METLVVGEQRYPMSSPFALFGSAIRRVGHSLDSLGIFVQGKSAYIETLVPSTRVVRVKGKELSHGMQAFVAPTATVVGDVSLGEQASVWYSATVRGDASAVKIGKNSSVQDGAALFGVSVGDNVSIGPGAYVSSCIIGDGAVIGAGAKVLPGSTVGKNAFVDAGAVVLPGTNIPSGELWTGSPAKKLRSLTVAETTYLTGLANTYTKLSEKHYEQSIKTVEQVEADIQLKEYREEHYMASDEPIPTTPDHVEQYYRLSATPADSGLFRTQNYDDAAALKQLIAEQDAADVEEEAILSKRASERRVWETAKLLAEVRPDRAFQRDAVLQKLQSVDPKAAAALIKLLQDAKTAKGDAAAEALFASELAKLSPKSESVVAADVAAALASHGAASKSLSA